MLGGTGGRGWEDVTEKEGGDCILGYKLRKQYNKNPTHVGNV